MFPAEQYFEKQKALVKMMEKEQKESVKVPMDIDMQIPKAKVNEKQTMKMEQSQSMVVGNNKVTFNMVLNITVEPVEWINV